MHSVEQDCTKSFDCGDDFDYYYDDFDYYYDDLGAFCNFDNTISGFCESCEGIESDQDCDNAGLITDEGRTECKLFCVGEF